MGMDPNVHFLGCAPGPPTLPWTSWRVDPLVAALAYAELGWPVLPCKPRGKEPIGQIVHHGALDARRDPEWIKWVWTRCPEANVALATGHAFDVVDVDDQRFEGLYLALLSTTPLVRTGRGLHFYIEATGASSRTRLLPGADLKGHGGYVIAPPSLHESGSRYSWVRPPTSAQLAPVPASIRKALERRLAGLTDRGGVVGRAEGAISDEFTFEETH